MIQMRVDLTLPLASANVSLAKANMHTSPPCTPAYVSPLISKSDSILFSKSPPFASNTSCTTSISIVGNICLNVSRAAFAALSCTRSISACIAEKSRSGVGARETRSRDGAGDGTCGGWSRAAEAAGMG